ncbi:MAG TPA: IclR family transcriptional regulator [Kiloniellales bacterium]|nr:IclR family transcriptional regulator [Kiloniellales bacterium]
MPASASDEASPVKTIDRAAVILNCLALGPQEGSRLSDIAVCSGLGKTTTHRLLAALVSVGFVDRGENKLYRLGYRLFALGSNARRFDLANLARPALLRLAAETEDTVFLSIRDGEEALCLDRCTGAYPIRTLTLNVGDRRPLGVGAGSLALLAFQPQQEVERLVAAHEVARAGYPNFSNENLKELIAQSRRRGFAFNDGRIVSAMAAVAVPVFGPDESLVAALSIAAIRERMQPERIAALVGSLQREAKDLGRLLQAREASKRSKQS